MIRVHGSVAFDTVGLVARLPDPDTTARIERLETRAGGAAGNVAVALARLGVPAALVAGVGPDFAGSAYELRLDALGVRLDGLVRSPSATAHAYVWTEASGRQATYFHPGAGRDLALAAPVPAEVGHFAAGEISVYPRLMEACGTVTFDPGQECFHRPLEQVAACLPSVDVLFANEHELERLRAGVGLTPERAWTLGLRALVVTRGAAGTDVLTPGSVERVPAVEAKAVDPTGAGDAHRAGFVAGLARGLPLAECARLGSVLAAFAVEAVGPQEGAFDAAAVRARYAKAYGRPAPP